METGWGGESGDDDILYQMTDFAETKEGRKLAQTWLRKQVTLIGKKLKTIRNKRRHFEKYVWKMIEKVRKCLDNNGDNTK